ncbi:MAG: carboxypeptidase-like regulatory domain-containing protein, partial [Acidobacteriota bacterium]
MFKTRLWCLCAILALAAAPLALAQGGQTGAVQGLATDKSGAVVPGVTITLRNLATNFERAVVSENNGGYRFPNLNPGNYQLRAELAGFAAFVVEDVVVQVGRITDVFIRLEPAGTQETITVTGAAPLVETTKTDIGGVVDNREVENLPLNGRNFSSLAQLIPGARPVGSWDPTKTRIGAISIAGAGGRNVNTTIDGIDNKDNTVGGYVQNITLEGVKEFAVKTQRFSAADGRSQGGMLSIVTKGGSNDFHGSFFSFFRDKKLNSNDYWSEKGGQEKPPFSREQFGGSIGGPIKKDKAFFFFTYERLQEDQFTIVSPDNVKELQALKDANISSYGASPGPASQLPTPYLSKLWTARMDLVINQNNNFYMSWNNSSDRTDNDQGATDLTSTNFNSNRNVTFSSVLNSMLGSRMVNQFVFGHSYWNNLIDTDQYTKVTVSFAGVGYGTNTNVPQQSYQKKWQFKDSFSWNMGAHAWRFGVDWVHEPILGGFFGYTPVPAVSFFDNPTTILTDKVKYPQGFNTPGIVQSLA